MNLKILKQEIDQYMSKKTKFSLEIVRGMLCHLDLPDGRTPWDFTMGAYIYNIIVGAAEEFYGRLLVSLIVVGLKSL